jgi:hypothetical protein
MRSGRLCSIFAAMLLLSAVSVAANAPDEPYKFIPEFVGLNDEQISEIRSGKAVAKVIESRAPDEVFVFGAVYIETTPESYLKFAADIDALRKLPSYLAIQSFSDPPQLADLQNFTLEQQDIKELKNCKPWPCEVQLPTESMEDFQRSIDWSAPDVADKVNRLSQRMALQSLLEYMAGGNAATHSDWIRAAGLLGLWQILIDYWIAPRVVGHELELHPSLAIFTTMVGGAIAGIVGIYLSIPVVAALRVMWRWLGSSSDEEPELLPAAVTSGYEGSVWP